MCLVTFAQGFHSDYALVLLANRDERYARPSAAMHFWDDYPELLAGRDLEHGGTWLGLTRSGRFATLTNHPFTQWQPVAPVSRGRLVSDFLNGTASAEEYLLLLRESRSSYEGYHLIFGYLTGELWVYSNVEDRVERYQQSVHSVGNTYDDLTKHKEMRSMALLTNYLEAVSEEATASPLEVDDLVALFQDGVPSDNLTLIPSDLSVEVARQNSSIFIKGDYFGTVGTTVILVGHDGWVTTKELRYNQEMVIEVTEKKFKLGPCEQNILPVDFPTNEVTE